MLKYSMIKLWNDLLDSQQEISKMKLINHELAERHFNPMKLVILIMSFHLRYSEAADINLIDIVQSTKYFRTLNDNELCLIEI
jgi:hypothetical protein